jgi:glycosyltransferase involved in cell wall biosynthesis
MASARPEVGSRQAPEAESISVLCVTLWGDRAEAETFIGLSRRGCRVRVCCMPNSAQLPRFEAAGIEVVPLTIRRRVDWAAIRRIRAELKSRHWDILHLLHNRAVSNGLLAVWGMSEVKVIAYRGIVGNVNFYSPSSWLRYLNPRVDRVICVAEAVRRHFLNMRWFGYRLPAQKFVTIHKGHDLSWYDAPRVDLGQFDVPPGAFVVGCVANWRPRKGVNVLLEAFAHVAAETPAYLLLAGTTKGRGLDAAIAAHPFRERIRNVGFRYDAPALIGACDVSVLPALKREGLPKTVIEAMAYGVPPIVTDVGGSPELVVDGSSGLVVPPGDALALAAAITRLYRDPKLRRRLGEQARRRLAEHFYIGDTVEKTLAIYRELRSPAGGTGGRAPRRGS